MLFYHKSGSIPAKRHTQFRKPDGSLYSEELFGTEGFTGVSSLLYHLHPPTNVKSIGAPIDVEPEIAVKKNLKSLCFKGFNIEPNDDYIASRNVLLMNNDLHIGLAAPKSGMSDYFFKNGEADELLFIHEGEGVLKTAFGNIKFKYGDYLVIPRGVIYQLEFKTSQNRLLFVESFSPIVTPKRYRNQGVGQFLEHSPFCERDFRLPENLQTHDETGEFEIKIKKQGLIHPYVYGNHPFDLVGWDGMNYPYAFSIFDFEPITGRIHMPPPIHQTFEGHNFVVCSFVPRMYDYHPQAIPAPYNHSNIDSDELLYYVEGNFMSRKNVEKGMITLHPGGVPHGPHPGTIEKSIGKKGTEELAVMIDPFKPLMVTKKAMRLEVADYYKSWLIL